MSGTRPDSARIVASAQIGALYLIGVGLIVLWPSQLTTPFRGLLAAMQSFMPYGDTLLEIGANVLLFIPVGLLAAWWLPRGRRWLGLLTGVLISLGAEIAQAAFLPGRVASVRDVVANSLGVLLGTGVAVAVERRRSHSVTPLVEKPE